MFTTRHVLWITSYMCVLLQSPLRVPTLLQHAILAARSMVSRSAAPERRAAQLGLLGFAYSLVRVCATTSHHVAQTPFHPPPPHACISVNTVCTDPQARSIA